MRAADTHVSAIFCVCACVCVCTCVCTCVYVRVCEHVCVSAHEGVCVCVCVYYYVYKYMHVPKEALWVVRWSPDCRGVLVAGGAKQFTHVLNVCVHGGGSAA